MLLHDLVKEKFGVKSGVISIGVIRTSQQFHFLLTQRNIRCLLPCFVIGSELAPLLCKWFLIKHKGIGGVRISQCFLFFPPSL